MRILVSGNQAEHLWPEACVRNLRAMGHEAEMIYYLVPQDRDLERYVPRSRWGDMAVLSKDYRSAKALMESLFLSHAQDFKPDLILLAGMYHTWSTPTLDELRKTCDAPIVLWSGDNPYERGATDIFTPSRHYDRTYFTLYGCAERASNDMACPTDFMSFGCDPMLDVVPDTSPAERESLRSSVSYLGTLKLDRMQVLDELARADVGLRVWSPEPPAGSLRPFPALAAARESETIRGVKARALYGASDIVLNLHHIGFGNMKFYEVAACGAFQFTNLRSHVDAVKEAMPVAKKVIAYGDGGDLVRYVRHFLDAPEERAANARELQDIVRTQHTWEFRLKTIIHRAFPAMEATQLSGHALQGQSPARPAMT